MVHSLAINCTSDPTKQILNRFTSTRKKTNTHRNDWQHKHEQYNTRVSECVLCPSSTYGFWLQLWYLSKLPSDKQVSTRCALGIPVYQLNADKLPIAEEMPDTIMSEYGTIQYFVANTS